MSLSCIQCQKNPAKWREQENPQNVYCRKFCQIKYHSIGLRDNPNIIGLEASDGTRVQITLTQAEQMETVKILAEDMADDYIPLPKVAGPDLLRIQTFFNQGGLDLNGLNDDEFLNLLKAAHFLGFQALLNYLIPHWVEARPFPDDPVLNDIIPLAIKVVGFRTALETAQTKGYLTLFEWLIADPLFNYNFQNIFLYIAFHGPSNVMARLLRHPRVTSIHHLIQDAFVNALREDKGQFEIADQLLQFDDSIDNYMIAVTLQNAANLNHLKVVEWVLQTNRVDPSLLENYPSPEIQALYVKYSKKKQKIGNRNK